METVEAVASFVVHGPADDRDRSEDRLRKQVAHFAAVAGRRVLWETYRVTETGRARIDGIGAMLSDEERSMGATDDDLLLRGEADTVPQ